MAEVIIERIESTGDFAQDSQVAREAIGSDNNGISFEQAQENEQKARDAALEPPRNALVEKPYNEGETVQVLVSEEGTTAEEGASVVSDGEGSADEATVDSDKSSAVTVQPVQAPHPSRHSNFSATIE